MYNSIKFVMKGSILMEKQKSRRDARIDAFKLIFMWENCDSIEFELDRLQSDEYKEHKKHMKYIRTAIGAFGEHKSEIDSVIAENLTTGWSMNRLSKMSLAILRLAVCEINYIEDIPTGVAINEAVELAKLYDSPKASGFVNGLLRGVLRKKEGEQQGE